MARIGRSITILDRGALGEFCSRCERRIAVGAPQARPPERSGATGPRERRRGGSAGAKPPGSSWARVIELTTRRGIAADDFAPHDVSEDVRVLIKTVNSRFWGSP